MPANRKHHAIDTATAERWKLLGRLLRARRMELGYSFRPAFAEARLPRTPQGNLSVRLLNAIENGERPGTYAPGRLEQFARAYEVTPQSIFAVLEGRAGNLEPAAAAPPPGLPPAPRSELLREDSVRPYAAPIWRAVRQLAARGVRDPDGNPPVSEAWSPSGAQLGLPPPDAKVWDGSRGAMSVEDQAWLAGDIRRRREARAAERDGNADTA